MKAPKHIKDVIEDWRKSTFGPGQQGQGIITTKSLFLIPKINNNGKLKNSRRTSDRKCQILG